MSKAQEILVLSLMLASAGLGYGFRNAQITSAATQTTGVKDNHTVVTTIVTKDPSGTVRTVKTTDSSTKTKTKESKQSNSTAPAVNKVNISALAGLDLSKTHALTPVYGVSISKQVLGPITVGAFGLTNGIIGVSLGVSF